MYSGEEFDPLQEADVQFGRFKTVDSFEGAVCDASLSFFALSPNEVAKAFEQGRKELKEEQSPTTGKGLLLRSQDEITRGRYAKKKSIPWDLVEGIVMHSKILQSQDEPIIEGEGREAEVHPRSQLRKYFDEHPGMEERCKLPTHQ